MIPVEEDNVPVHHVPPNIKADAKSINQSDMIPVKEDNVPVHHVPLDGVPEPQLLRHLGPVPVLQELLSPRAGLQGCY